MRRLAALLIRLCRREHAARVIRLPNCAQIEDQRALARTVASGEVMLDRSGDVRALVALTTELAAA
jgi:hypothetical protein